jgi:hypothetical protein
MINLFQNLENLIDRWLAIRYEKAVDKLFFIDEYFNENNFDFIQDYNDTVWLRKRKEIYKAYQMGNFSKAQNYLEDALDYEINKVNKKDNPKPLKIIKSPKTPLKDEKTFDKIIKARMPEKKLNIDELKIVYRDAEKSIKQYILVREAKRKIKYVFHSSDDNIRIEKIRNLAEKNINPFELTKNTLTSTKDIVKKTINNDFEEEKINNDNEEEKNRVSVFNKKLQYDTIVNCFGKLKVVINQWNENPYLTDEQFNDFVDAAFYGKKLDSKITINMKPHGEKLKIQGVFFNFYYVTCHDLFGTAAVQEKYIRLLTDNFDTFKFNSIKGNFKPKSKRDNDLI